MSIDVKQTRAVCEAATRGPWKMEVGVYEDPDGDNDIAFARGPMIARKPGDPYHGAWRQQARANADFIALARTALPEALNEIDRLRAEVERLKKSDDEHASERLREFYEYKNRRNTQHAAYELQHRATIAFLLDRAEQYTNSSGYRAFVDELVGSIAEYRHVRLAEAGEYDDMNERIDRIVKSRLSQIRALAEGES